MPRAPSPAAPLCCVRAMHTAKGEGEADIGWCGALRGRRWQRGRESCFSEVPVQERAGATVSTPSDGCLDASTRTKRRGPPTGPGCRHRRDCGQGCSEGRGGGPQATGSGSPVIAPRQYKHSVQNFR